MKITVKSIIVSLIMGFIVWVAIPTHTTQATPPKPSPSCIIDLHGEFYGALQYPPDTYFIKRAGVEIPWAPNWEGPIQVQVGDIIYVAFPAPVATSRQATVAIWLWVHYADGTVGNQPNIIGSLPAFHNFGTWKVIGTCDGHDVGLELEASGTRLD